ncbi:MAG TPA: metallophosphoesterase [Vicinamibacteria bacterium]|nr:metallophosphoesterase [Vicinamibacteria bacterium]
MKNGFKITVLSVVLSFLAVVSGRPADSPTVTFFVASDSHFGAAGMAEANRVLVEQMNSLPGTEYPAEIGGRVETPRGVLFTGDTTDNGRLDEFAEFESVYGLTGKDGLLRYPIFESIGNHDLNAESPIKERAKARHGDIDYAWSWDGLRFVCLDMYPDEKTRAFLARELEKVGRDRPVILYFHYSLEGPYSDFWEQQDKEDFARVIDGYNVAAIFHGHEHRMGHYVWRGHPVFRPGAPRHSSHAFLAVRVGPTEMSVAAWDFDNRKWLSSWTVPVRR